jgi:hypothetical protein
MEPSSNIIHKYSISEKDLYILGLIEERKKTSSFLAKEKLKSKSLSVLKPYNVKFSDLGLLLEEIRNQNYHSDQYLSEKYGKINIENGPSSFGLKYFIPLILAILGFYYIINSFNGPSACDCGNLYENSPWTKDYSAEELNDGHTLRDDANDYVEKAKQCAIKFGKLSDIEEELAKSSLEMNMIPNLDKAISNAKVECNK